MNQLFASVALATALSLSMNTAQAQTTVVTPAAQPSPRTIRTFYLAYATAQYEQNEVLTALRNIASPQVKIFLTPSRNEITASGSPEDMKIMEEMLARLDVPHKLYRLTYIFTESDGGKRVGVQRYTMTLPPGQRMQMKQGSRVPFATSSDAARRTTEYIDVGLNFDSQVDDYGPGVRLKSRVEQSSIAEERSSIGPESPVIRQTMLEGVSSLTEGKPLTLGTLDVMGSTRHIEVEALVEAMK
jgi:type II secretory pathway component GspD/PulD (secretin)